MATEERVQKYISDCGVMSRRAAEREIELGKITINGTKASLGDKVIPGKDVVKYDGTIIKKEASNREKRYILLNKPVGYLTSMSDDRGRHCVSELVGDVGCRVYPCGRLDMNSDGLLILTNDGDFANKITHPGHGFSKSYHVKLYGQLGNEDIAALSSPMEIDGYQIKPVKVWLVSSKKDYTILGFKLYEGRNRQIRKMCEQCGYEVLSLRRVSIGTIELGTLKPGQWRDMSKKELNSILSFSERKKTK